MAVRWKELTDAQQQAPFQPKSQVFAAQCTPLATPLVSSEVYMRTNQLVPWLAVVSE